MKRVSLSVLTLAAAFVAAPVSQAFADMPPGWYAGLGVGANWEQNSTVGNETVKYAPGLDVLGHGGYAFMNGLRLDGEVWHGRSNVTEITGSGTHNGDLDNTDLFINGFYDFHTGTRFSPYVGAGAGVAFVQADNIGPLHNNSASYLNGSTEEFAYQGIAGVAAQLDPHWVLSVDYRYIATASDPKLALSLGGNNSTQNTSHNVIFGLQYNWGKPEPAVAMEPVTAPVVTPRPAPKTAVAPIPQSYMVFFDFNKSDLTPEAKRIIASAAADLKRGGVVRVVVTGHTDTVGSVPYNVKLSEKRADSVKAEFERLGIGADEVETRGVGKDGLLVPTADQVREAQNRRAEIVFEKH